MLILLDIDGVMVPQKSWKPVEQLNDGFSKFSEKSIRSLNRIISETHASIILTSSHKSRYSVSKWRDIFKNRGINTSITLLDENTRNLNRKEEILNWLKNRHTNEDYIIIDDDKSLNALPSNIKKLCILTSPLIGLDENSYDMTKIITKSQPHKELVNY